MNRVRRILLIGLGGLVVFGLLAPFLSADRLRPRIEAALETALNRPVHVGAVRLNLFSGPGFSVKDVLIDDDPAAGVEPFAHVETMRARVSWITLLGGHLAFSSLTLDAPSVNLVKMPSGPWNIERLIDRASRGNPAGRGQVPDIQIRGGRLNFKFGDVKSIFFISDADLDIYPNQNGEVVIRFSGAPARTDRGSQAFGELSARGLLKPRESGENELSMGLHMERTAISEVMRLLDGRDLGMHGFAVANANLSGPVSKLSITGDLNITDIHRWDLMAPGGQGWTLNYKGSLDLRGHEFNLETQEPSGPLRPVAFRFRMVNFLGTPKWGATLSANGLPASSLLETARHMGAPFPAGMQVDGAINGGIGYSSESGFDGQLVCENASLTFPQGPTVGFDSARIVLDRNRVLLAPASARLPNGQSAEVEAGFALDTENASIKISSRQFTIAGVPSGSERLPETPRIPLLENVRTGTWKGWIAFAKLSDKATWSGEFELQNAVMDVPGFSTPVRLLSASVEMSDDRVRVDKMRGRAASVGFEGSYRSEAASGGTQVLKLRIPSLELVDFQKLVTPVLRRNEGFLARTFRFRNETLPPWMAGRKLDGTIAIGSLTMAGEPLGNWSGHLNWDGTSAVFSDLRGQLAEMRANGKLTLNLGAVPPSYQIAGAIRNLDYHDGKLDLQGELRTSGAGTDLIRNLRGEGTFEGHDIGLTADAQMTDISGAYRLAPALDVPRLVLSNVQVTQGAENLYGQGSVQPDGHILLDLTSGRRQVRLTGMLLPWRSDPATTR